MSEPDVACDKCDERLENAVMIAETVVARPDGAIGIGLHQRSFEGNCPKHGHRRVQSAGEGHSTLLKSRLRKLFPVADRRALRAAPSREDYRVFEAAAAGQRWWDEDDVARWRSAIEGGAI